MIAALLLAAAASASPAPACPATLAGRETAQAPEGWRAWSSLQGGSHPLRDVTFSDGDPAGLTFLTPSASAPGKRGARTDRYDFRGESFGVIWMACQYADTSQTLVRATALKGSVCRVAYDAAGGVSPPFALSCRRP